MIYLILFTIVLSINCFSQSITKYFSPDPDPMEMFGYSLAIDSEFLVIAERDSVFTTQSVGAVYIYKRDGNNFNFIQELHPDTIRESLLYGVSVELADSFLYVGSLIGFYIYKYVDSMFTLQTKILHPEGSYGFGQFFSIQNNDLIIGDSHHFPNAKGAAFYYKLINKEWVFHQKLYSNNVERYAYFGTRVSISGNYAVITASFDGFESGHGRGSVFLFEKSDTGWVEKQKILPTDTAYAQAFGVDLAIEQNTIAIGASGGLNHQFEGRIYIYKIINGEAVLTDSIFASDNYPGNNFSRTFRLRGDSLFVGASGKFGIAAQPKPFYNSGQTMAAYLFVNTGDEWEEKIKFDPPNPHPQNIFGLAVDFKDGNFLIGSPGDTSYGLKSGSAYLFQPNVVSVEINSPQISGYSLYQNYPNPFNPTTTIKYSVKETGMVSLTVYDILGKEITSLVNEIKPPGEYSVQFDGAKLSSGIYFYTFRSGSFTSTKKLLLLK